MIPSFNPLSMPLSEVPKWKESFPQLEGEIRNGSEIKFGIILAG
jgi:hypothetical protein